MTMEMTVEIPTETKMETMMEILLLDQDMVVWSDPMVWYNQDV